MLTPEQIADLQWLVGMAFSAPPGWFEKGDGKRFDRIQTLFSELSDGRYTKVLSRFEERKLRREQEKQRHEQETR